jgi:hypothetical protein
VKEHSDGVREPDHLERPEFVLAPATTRTSRQAKRAFEVGMRRQTPLGRSASIGSGSCPGVRSATRTVTGRRAAGAGIAGR